MASKIATEMTAEEITMDMTPMIDCTFLLLIFFMCTLNFKSMEGLLISNLPKEEGIFNVASKSNPMEPIHIALKNAPGSIQITVGSDSMRDFDEVYSRVRLFVQQSVMLAENKPIPYILIVDDQVAFAHVISAINVAHKINNENIGKELSVEFKLTN
jgi:biopolymer transport protein ExbD